MLSIRVYSPPLGHFQDKTSQPASQNYANNIEIGGPGCGGRIYEHRLALHFRRHRDGGLRVANFCPSPVWIEIF